MSIATFSEELLEGWNKLGVFALILVFFWIRVLTHDIFEVEGEVRVEQTASRRIESRATTM